MIAFLLGVLGLAGLEVVLSSDRATNLVGGTAAGLAAITQRLISPHLGLIPNLHDSQGPAGSSTTPPAAGSPATPPPLPPGPSAVPRRPTARAGRSTDPTAGRAPIIAPPSKGS